MEKSQPPPLDIKKILRARLKLSLFWPVLDGGTLSSPVWQLQVIPEVKMTDKKTKHV